MLFIPLSTLKLWAAQVQDGLTTTQQQQLLKLFQKLNTKYRKGSESKVECLSK